MNAIMDWMQGSWLGHFAVDSSVTWPTMESLHFLGMCLLIGSLLIMDLRLMGYDKASSVASTDKLMPLALVGFSINLLSGIVFVFGDPHRYFINISFQLKMLLVFLAVLNFLFFKYKVEPMVADIGPGEDTPMLAKVVGGLSLVLWIGVLCYGRLIPYLGTG